MNLTLESAGNCFKMNGKEQSVHFPFNSFQILFAWVDTFHRMDSGYPLRDFVSRPEFGIQISLTHPRHF